MADNETPPPPRLMNFVSADQLEEARRTRGARVDDGTAQRDRSLYEILKDNKDKKDAEFNERFKHRPPKALDEDETEFLDKLEMSRREHERQIADEEEKQLRNFQAAVAAQSSVNELKEAPSCPDTQALKSAAGRKDPSSRALSMFFKVRPQAKKAKFDHAYKVETLSCPRAGMDDIKQIEEPAKAHNLGSTQSISNIENQSGNSSISRFDLVSYSDESEDEE